jgi:hypothetical protein
MHSTKIQHYVPKFYLLDGFSENGMIQVFDSETNNTFKTNPKNVASQGHFYTISGDDPMFYEEAFSDLEYQAQQVFHFIDSRINKMNFSHDSKAKKIPLNINQMCALLTYIAIQYMRTPARREVILKFQKQIASKLDKFRKTNLPTLSYADETENTITDILKKTDISNDEFCSYIKSMTAPLARLFLARDWNILRFEDSDKKVITSDNPVSIISKKNYTSTYPGDPESLLYFPINSKTVFWAPFDLQIANRKDFFLLVKEVKISDPDFEKLHPNIITMWFARQRIFGHKESIMECSNLLKKIKSDIGDQVISSLLRKVN